MFTKMRLKAKARKFYDNNPIGLPENRKIRKEFVSHVGKSISMLHHYKSESGLIQHCWIETMEKQLETNFTDNNERKKLEKQRMAVVRWIFETKPSEMEIRDRLVQIAKNESTMNDHPEADEGTAKTNGDLPKPIPRVRRRSRRRIIKKSAESQTVVDEDLIKNVVKIVLTTLNPNVQADREFKDRVQVENIEESSSYQESSERISAVA